MAVIHPLRVFAGYFCISFAAMTSTNALAASTGFTTPENVDNSTGITCENTQSCYGTCSGKTTNASECVWQYKNLAGYTCTGSIHGSLCAPARGQSIVISHTKGAKNVLYNGDPKNPNRHVFACRFIDNNSNGDLTIPQDNFSEFANFINKAIAPTTPGGPMNTSTLGLGFCVMDAVYAYMIKPENYGFQIFGEGGPRAGGLGAAWAKTEHGTWHLPTTRVADAQGNLNVSWPQTARASFTRQDCIPNTNQCNTRNITEVRTMAVPILPSPCTDYSISENRNCNGRWDMNSSHLKVLKREFYVERLDVVNDIVHKNNLANLDKRAVNGPYPDDMRDYQPPRQ